MSLVPQVAGYNIIKKDPDYNFNSVFVTDNVGTSARTSGFLIREANGNLKDIFKILKSNGGNRTNNFVDTGFYIGSVAPQNSLGYFLTPQPLFTSSGIGLATVGSSKFPAIPNNKQIMYIISGSDGSITFTTQITILQIFLVGGGSSGGGSGANGFAGEGGNVTISNTVRVITPGTSITAITIGAGGVGIQGPVRAGNATTLTVQSSTLTGARGYNGSKVIGTLNTYNNLYYGGAGGAGGPNNGLLGGGGGGGGDPGVFNTSNSTAGGKGGGISGSLTGGAAGAAGTNTASAQPGNGGPGGNSLYGGGGGGGGGKSNSGTLSGGKGGSGGNSSSTGSGGGESSGDVSSKSASGGAGGDGGENTGGGGGGAGAFTNNTNTAYWSAGGSGGSGIIVIVYTCP